MSSDIDFEIDNGIVIKYEGDKENVIIPSGVKVIGESAFSGCYKLSSVTISSDVTTIGEGAFFNCTNLISVIIPDSVTTIGAKAFSYCTRLRSITIPDNVEIIEYESFFYCINLINVTIGNKVNYIGKKAFSGCSKLSSINLPKSIIFVDDRAFYNCTKLSSDIISTIEELGKNKKICISKIKDDWILEKNKDDTLAIVSYKGNDEDIIIPDEIDNCKVTSIEEGAFSPNFCEYTNKREIEIKRNVKSITIPKSVTAIKNSAFHGCSRLSSINIPESVTEIGESAFNGCYNLSSITIPYGVTTIKECTFYDCKSLNSVIIPSSVISIGDSAFYNCTSVDNIIIPDSVKTMEANVFSYCTNLRSIVIPKSVTKIRYEAFRCCTRLSSVTLPKGVNSIEENAFQGCTRLKNFTLENNELKIQKRWFNSSLKIIKALVGSFYPKQLSTDLKAELIEEIIKQLNKSDSLDSAWSTSWLKYLKSRRKSLYEQIIENEDLLNLMIKERFLSLEDVKSLISLSSEKSLVNVSSILVEYQNKSFSEKEVLNATFKELNVNTSSVAYLKKIWSFKKKEDNTLSITSYKGTVLEVVVPDVIGKNKVTSIEKGAFSPTECNRVSEEQREIRRNIKSITIPSNVTSIHKDAFAGCESLTKVIILKSRTSDLVIYNAGN